jgi:2-polyprenyl-3-methyl-5-hydroxy-6-metoxy-1,4-benzoquinol methylase
MAPDIYTHGHHDAVLRSHRWRTAENSAAYLLPHLRAGQQLLDVGCGPGTLTVDLARRVAPGRVVGVDTSSQVVDEARAHAAAAGVANVELVAADFRDGGFEAGSFDVVHAHQVLQHLSDPIGALAAMAALARPGGLVAARDSDYPAFTWWPPEPGLDRWLEVYLAVARRNGAEPDAGRRLRHWARAAGLADVVYSTSTWTFAGTEDRRWWADLWAERSLASSFAGQAVAYEVAAPEELQEIASGWQTWAGYEDAVFIVVHGEILARI